MPYCHNNRCPYDGIWQEESEFTRDSNLCKTCRNKQMKRVNSTNTNNLKVKEELVPGDPPTFRTESDKERYNQWLRDLVKEVIRSETK